MFFPDEPKVGVKTIKQYAQMMKDENVNRAILVVQVNLTPHARQSLVEVQSRFLLEQVRRAITPTSLSPCPVTCFSGGAAPPRNPSCVRGNGAGRINHVVRGLSKSRILCARPLLPRTGSLTEGWREDMGNGWAVPRGGAAG